MESEKAMAPHSSTFALKIPWREEPGRLWSMRSLRVRHDWVTSLSLFTFMHWRRKRQPTPVFLPGESQGWGSLVGYGGVTQSWTWLKWLSSSGSSRYWSRKNDESRSQSEIISRENEHEGSVELVWGCFAVKSKRKIRRKAREICWVKEGWGFKEDTLEHVCYADRNEPVEGERLRTLQWEDIVKGAKSQRDGG